MDYYSCTWFCLHTIAWHQQKIRASVMHFALGYPFQWACRTHKSNAWSPPVKGIDLQNQSTLCLMFSFLCLYNRAKVAKIWKHWPFLLKWNLQLEQRLWSTNTYLYKPDENYTVFKSINIMRSISEMKCVPKFLTTVAKYPDATETNLRTVINPLNW